MEAGDVEEQGVVEVDVEGEVVEEVVVEVDVGEVVEAEY